MGHWEKGGVYVPSRLEAARQEKNRWKRRTNVAENRLRQIRNIVDGDMADAEALDAISDALSAWEEESPDAPRAMQPRDATSVSEGRTLNCTSSQE